MKSKGEKQLLKTLYRYYCTAVLLWCLAILNMDAPLITYFALIKTIRVNYLDVNYLIHFGAVIFMILIYVAFRVSGVFQTSNYENYAIT